MEISCAGALWIKVDFLERSFAGMGMSFNKDGESATIGQGSWCLYWSRGYGYVQLSKELNASHLNESQVQAIVSGETLSYLGAEL